jgi:hypothetical protein
LFAVDVVARPTSARRAWGTLGLATGLLGLAVMTQSRGAAWSMAVTLVLMFALCPGRLRLLFYLVVPGFLMVYAVPQLSQYWTLGPETLEGAMAARVLTVVVIAAGFIGMILALLEGWIRVSRRMKGYWHGRRCRAAALVLCYRPRQSSGI